MVPKMRLAEADEILGTLGAAAGLFITDRCPVGCGHCSVDSRADSPRITDFALFSEIIDVLCASDFTVIGVTGGEPFIERRALTEAVGRLADAGKRVIVYTSGIWATGAVPPLWIDNIIEGVSCAFVSTDAFHQDKLPKQRFQRAVRAFTGHGVPVVVQVIAKDDMVDRARHQLELAIGPSWADHAEIRKTQPLPYGRGAEVFRQWAPARGASFGPCAMSGLPLIRYDGTISLCCNEALIMGRGPEGLRRRCASGAEVQQALAFFLGHPLFRAIRYAGFGVLTQHPRLADLAEREFNGICQLCWELTGRALREPSDSFFEVAAGLGRQK